MGKYWKQSELEPSAVSQWSFFCSIFMASLVWRIFILLKSDEVYRGTKWVEPAVQWLADPRVIYVSSGNQGALRALLPAIPIYLTGNPFSARWFMMGLGVAILIPFFLMCRKLFGAKTALVATCLLGFLPSHVVWSVSSEAMVAYTTFFMLAMYGLVLLMEEKASWKALSLVWIGVSLGFGIRFEIVLVALVPMGFLWLLRKRGTVIAIAVATIATPVLWLIAFTLSGQSILYVLRMSHEMASGQIAGYFLLSDPDSTWQRLAVFPYVTGQLLTPALFLLALAGWIHARKNQTATVVGATSLLVLAFLSWGSYNGTVTSQERYVIPVVALFVPFAAHFMTALSGRLPKKWAVVALAALTLTVCADFGVRTYAQRHLLDGPTRQMIQWVKENVSPQPGFYLQLLPERSVFAYHLGFQYGIYSPDFVQMSELTEQGPFIPAVAFDTLRKKKLPVIILNMHQQPKKVLEELESAGLAARLLVSVDQGLFGIFNVDVPTGDQTP